MRNAAKNFAYVCFGLMCLTVAYQFGIEDSQADMNPAGIVHASQEEAILTIVAMCTNTETMANWYAPRTGILQCRFLKSQCGTTYLLSQQAASAGTKPIQMRIG